MIHKTSYIIHFFIFWFYLMSFFTFSLHIITFSHHILFFTSLDYDSFLDFPCFYDLHRWRHTGHVFYRMSINWSLFDVFLKSILGSWALEIQITGINWPSHHIKRTCYLSMWVITVDANLAHLDEIVFVRFR